MLLQHIPLAMVLVFFTFGRQKLLFQKIFGCIQPMKGLGGVRGEGGGCNCLRIVGFLFFNTTVFIFCAIEKESSFLPDDMNGNIAKITLTAKNCSGMLRRCYHA